MLIYTVIERHRLLPHSGSCKYCCYEHGCTNLFHTLLSVLLGIYTEVKLLDHVVILFLLSYGIAILFSTVAVPFYIYITRVPISPQPQHLLFFFFFYSIHPNGVKYYPIVILICIALLVSNAEHLFMCLLTICIFSLEK